MNDFRKGCGRGCQPHWDVRCCCEWNCPSKNTKKQFMACQQKLSTIYFMLGNDYGLYTLVEEGEWDEIKRFFKLKRGEIRQLKEWWDEDHPEESE